MSPGSCSSGFKSAPSKGTGKRRVNGLEVNNINIKKPILIVPMTPITRDKKYSGKRRLKKVTAIVHIFRINTHSSNDPSCAPHTAENR